MQRAGHAIEFCKIFRQAISLEMRRLAIVVAQEIGALSCITIMFSLFSNCNIWHLTSTTDPVVISFLCENF
jgi:hypothetical protein